MRRLGGCFAALAALLLAGCAAMKSQPADAEGAAADTGPTTSLEVVGPAPLAALLERHLDVARVGRLARGEAIDDAEWERLIAAAPAQAREILQTEGYFEPKIDIARVGEPGSRKLRLDLDPGPATRVSRVTLEVQGSLQEAADAGDARAKETLEALDDRWPMPPGHVFRNADWRNAKASALARLRAAGYATAQWSGTGAEVDAPTAGARLFLVAESGPLFRYGDLDVEGLGRHDLETVRNLANFEPGTPVSEALLLDYQERLQRSGLVGSPGTELEFAL